MTSLTPPRRQASIWQNEMAPACKSCLKRTRFWQCSPVATPTGATALGYARRGRGRRRGSWAPRSSTGRTRARRSMFSMASSTSQTWFASIISLRSGPISSLMRAARRTSSSMSPPTFILKCVPALRHRLAHERAHPLVRIPEPARRTWCRRGNRPPASRPHGPASSPRFGAGSRALPHV